MDYNPAPIGVLNFFLVFGGIGVTLAFLFAFMQGPSMIRKATQTVWSWFSSRTQALAAAASATPASATPAVVVSRPLTGPVLYDGRWYGSCAAAAGYLGHPMATIEAAVNQDPSAQAGAFWRGPQKKIALSHRVMKVGKTRSRVFVREYNDHQTAYVRRKDGIFQIHGRFTRGQSGDEAILRLAAAV